MNVRTEIIIKKIEEKLVSVKRSLTNHEKKATEDLISIKAYCDLLLEAENSSCLKQEIPMTTERIGDKCRQEKYDSDEETNSDSLFDF